MLSSIEYIARTPPQKTINIASPASAFRLHPCESKFVQSLPLLDRPIQVSPFLSPSLLHEFLHASCLHTSLSRNFIEIKEPLGEQYAKCGYEGL